MVLIALAILAAAVLLILGFVAPRRSRGPQSGLDHTLDGADARGSRAPGLLGRIFDRTAKASRKVIDGSAETGRRGRRDID